MMSNIYAALACCLLLQTVSQAYLVHRYQPGQPRALHGLQASTGMFLAAQDRTLDAPTYQQQQDAPSAHGGTDHAEPYAGFAFYGAAQQTVGATENAAPASGTKAAVESYGSGEQRNSDASYGHATPSYTGGYNSGESNGFSANGGASFGGLRAEAVDSDSSSRFGASSQGQAFGGYASGGEEAGFGISGNVGDAEDTEAISGVAGGHHHHISSYGAHESGLQGDGASGEAAVGGSAAGDHGSHHEHHEATPYVYEYSVKDPHTHDFKSQKESSDGHVVKGRYTVVQPDGKLRTVEYVADWKHGFQAKVHFSEAPKIDEHGQAQSAINFVLGKP